MLASERGGAPKRPTRQRARMFPFAQQGTVKLPLIYQNGPWALAAKVACPANQEFRVHGVALSWSGKELMNIVDIELNEKYTLALNNFFEEQGVTLTRIRQG
jgi:hypothetical protein